MPKAALAICLTPSWRILNSAPDRGGFLGAVKVFLGTPALKRAIIVVSLAGLVGCKPTRQAQENLTKTSPRVGARVLRIGNSFGKSWMVKVNDAEPAETLLSTGFASGQAEVSLKDRENPPLIDILSQ